MKSKRLLFGLGAFALLLILGSAFLVYALAPSISQFVQDASRYTNRYTDQQLLTLFSRGTSLLPTDQQAVLGAFTNDDVLAVARGSERGVALVGSLTPEQTTAANAFLIMVFDHSCEASSQQERASVGQSVRLSCMFFKPGTPRLRACAPPPAGRCSPGPPAETVCQDGTDSGNSNDWGCSYACGPGGVWVTPGTRCSQYLCTSTQTC